MELRSKEFVQPWLLKEGEMKRISLGHRWKDSPTLSPRSTSRTRSGSKLKTRVSMRPTPTPEAPAPTTTTSRAWLWLGSGLGTSSGSSVTHMILPPKTSMILFSSSVASSVMWSKPRHAFSKSTGFRNKFLSGSSFSGSLTCSIRGPARALPSSKSFSASARRLSWIASLSFSRASAATAPLPFEPILFALFAALARTILVHHNLWSTVTCCYCRRRRT